jgi:hypothetical protein
MINWWWLSMNILIFLCAIPKVSGWPKIMDLLFAAIAGAGIATSFGGSP